MANFGPKRWVNPLGKMSIFRVFERFVFIASTGGFFVLEYPKRHFPRLNCLKKKIWKNGTFGLKPWVNPLGKMSIFRVFEALVFIA